MVLWYEALAHQLPVHLENDANCVDWWTGLAHPRLKMQPVLWLGQDRWAMIIMASFTGRHGLRWVYYIQIRKLNNWSQLASTGNMVAMWLKIWSVWLGRRKFKRRRSEISQEAIERTNRNSSLWLPEYPYLIDPDVISLGGSNKSESRFYQRGSKSRTPRQIWRI